MEELPTRWEVELEFVQSLANIQYVNYLAQNDYLSDPKFVEYLKYLNYWKETKFAKYVVYPNCLHILTLLQNEEFRKSIVNPEFMNTLMNDMVKKWQNVDDVFNPSTDNDEAKADGQNEIKKEENDGADLQLGQIPRPPEIDVDRLGWNVYVYKSKV